MLHVLKSVRIDSEVTLALISSCLHLFLRPFLLLLCLILSSALPLFLSPFLYLSYISSLLSPFTDSFPLSSFCPTSSLFFSLPLFIAFSLSLFVHHFFLRPPFIITFSVPFSVLPLFFPSFSLYLFLSLSSFCPTSCIFFFFFFFPLYIPFPLSLSVLPRFFPSLSLYIFLSSFCPTLSLFFLLPLFIPFPLSLYVLPHFFPAILPLLFFSPFLFLSYLISFLLRPFIYFVPHPTFLLHCQISTLLLFCSPTTESLTHCAGIYTCGPS